MGAEAISWGAVALSAIAMIGTITDRITRRSADRDRQEFDAKFVEMKTELANCEERHAESQADRDELKRRVGDQDRELQEVKRQSIGFQLELAAIRGRVTAQENKG